jgi:c-di-GMP-binding flagellar brake protein YcgR
MPKNAGWKRNLNNLEKPDGRQHPRALLYLPVEYRGNSPNTLRLGHTSDLSPDGVMLNLSERLRIGQRINLSIFVSLGKDVEAIKANSQVVWVDGANKDGSFRSGVKFIDLSASDRKKLEDFFKKY